MKVGDRVRYTDASNWGYSRVILGKVGTVVRERYSRLLRCMVVEVSFDNDDDTWTMQSSRLEMVHPCPMESAS